MKLFGFPAADYLKLRPRHIYSALLYPWEYIRSRADMKRLDTRPISKRSDEIRLFAVVRDEAARLPYFLEYYREMGVDRMFFIDHSSTDATVDKLLSAPDTHVFRVSGNFRRKAIWLRLLMTRYAVGGWSIVLDADEFFVHPRLADLGLRQLCEYCDSVGATAVRCRLIDMYPKGPLCNFQYEPGTDPLSVADHFDVDALTRHRVFGIGVNTRKYPLIRFSRKVRIRPGQHRVLNCTESPTSGALLHFKFLPDFSGNRTHELAAAARQNRLLDPAWAQETERYAKFVGENGEIDLSGPESIRYRNVRQLEELGVVCSHPSLEAFQNSRMDAVPGIDRQIAVGMK